MADSKCILVIDDEDMIRDVIKTALTEAGYRVVGAANGAEGLKVLKSEQVDLVITDILMPEREGVETIIEIKKSLPEIPVIAISGGGRVHNFYPLQIAERIGADRTLSKPFEPADLLRVIEDLGVAPPRSPPDAKRPSQ